jgi:oligoendopeptidase F
LRAATPYRAQRWTLRELLPDTHEATVTARLAALEEAVTRFEAARPELGVDLGPERLLALLRQYEEICERMAVLAAYGSLWFAEDTQSTAALAYRNRIEHALAQLDNRILFFPLWWKGLDEEAAARLLPSAPSEGDARHFLADLRRLRPYTLEERVEQVINLKDADGIQAVLTVYSMLTNRLEFTLEVEGERRTLTRDELMAHVQSPSPELREAAYVELHRVFDAQATVLGQIYVHRVQDWASEQVDLRGHADAIAARHAANDVPAEAVEALLAATREHVGLFQRYFRWKAGALGRARLRRYDLYAPLAPATRQMPYGEAVALVLDTLGSFAPVLSELAERVFEDGHVDAEPRKGKKGGAFCATVLPDLRPWVLLNYTGRLRDVATLAHELGHAVHSLLAAEHSLLTQHPSLPLAETASVFAEMLLTDRLLAEVPDAGARRELLAAKLDDVYATVVRQVYFTLFEVEAHSAVLEGRRTEELDALYARLLAEQFADAVEVAPEFAREWVAIPHLFHTPFYCYAYAFGQLLVLALYRRYREQGQAFVPGYLRSLAWGGAARPLDILGEAGIDPRTPDFWRGGFRLVEDLLAELEALGPAAVPA